MTKQELNRDAKRLFKDHFNGELSEDGKKEFSRIYCADSGFDYLTADNIKRMIRFNLRHRIVALHNFGLSIDESKL